MKRSLLIQPEDSPDKKEAIEIKLKNTQLSDSEIAVGDMVILLSDPYKPGEPSKGNYCEVVEIDEKENCCKVKQHVMGVTCWRNLSDVSEPYHKTIHGGNAHYIQAKDGGRRSTEN